MQNSTKICCVTWPKEAHGLFDYEAENINSMVAELAEGGKIVRNQDMHETKYVPTEKSGFFLTGGEVNKRCPPDAIAYFYQDNNDKIFLSSNVNNSYVYNQDNLQTIQNNLWYVVEQKETKGIRKEYQSHFKYACKQGDIIRFGRVQFVIRNLNIPNGAAETRSCIYLPNDNDEVEWKKGMKCSVCKREETDPNLNPVFKICSCEGAPLFHLSCFKDFTKKSNDIGVKEVKVNPNLTIINVYNFICQYCNEPFNSIIKKNNKEFNILPYEIPSNGIPYLILESLNFVKGNIFTAMVMIFQFPKRSEEFFLGRGHEATFKVSDISISRVHSKIYFKSDSIWLDDCGSKFGTMVLVQKDANSEDMVENKLKIQTGRSVIWLKSN